MKVYVRHLNGEADENGFLGDFTPQEIEALMRISGHVGVYTSDGEFSGAPLFQFVTCDLDVPGPYFEIIYSEIS